MGSAWKGVMTLWLHEKITRHRMGSDVGWIGRVAFSSPFQVVRPSEFSEGPPESLRGDIR